MCKGLFNQEVPNVNDIPAQRILAAVGLANEAFWDAIGEAFPEVTGGDFPPDVTVEWERARNQAVWAHLTYNSPRHHPDKHLRLTPADLPGHIQDDHFTDPAEAAADPDVVGAAADAADVGDYLAGRGISATGNRSLDVLAAWHAMDHPGVDLSVPAGAGAGAGGDPQEPQAPQAIRLTVELTVHEPARLRAFAMRRYLACWGDDGWEPADLGEAAYEALIASNGTRTAPSDYGIELCDHHWTIHRVDPTALTVPTPPAPPPAHPRNDAMPHYIATARLELDADSEIDAQLRIEAALEAFGEPGLVAVDEIREIDADHDYDHDWGAAMTTVGEPSAAEPAPASSSDPQGPRPGHRSARQATARPTGADGRRQARTALVRPDPTRPATTSAAKQP